MSAKQIIHFLEDFRKLHQENTRHKSRLISIKVAEPLLQSFKTKARLAGILYQTQIKYLMREWLD